MQNSLQRGTVCGPRPTLTRFYFVAALRALLAAKDDEIRTLKAKVHEHESTIALLCGQLDGRTPNQVLLWVSAWS